MTAERSRPYGWPSEMEALLNQLRDETITAVLLGLFVIGTIVGITSESQPARHGVVIALPLFALLFAGWTLHKHNWLVAWLLVLGCIAVDLLAATWGGLPAVLYLLALPVALAALLISAKAGLSTATVTTLLVVLVTPGMLRVAPGQQAVTLMGIWCTLGIIWLTLHPLLTVVQWAWSNYERGLELVEQARDSQVRLEQTLEDLADSNEQLTRLNRLADGLRYAAEEASTAKGQFVANVSHELRTPLNMIIGFSELILKKPQAYGGHIPPALLADLSIVHQNSQHLLGLINDVLDLSQIEAKRMGLTKEWVELPGLVGAAVVAVRPLFESKGLYLNVEIAEELPLVHCDRTRVREVLLNLLSNAGRFTERGGVVLDVQRACGDVLLSVADTGPGIAQSDVDRVFEPFQQVDTSIRRRHGGSGLGLAISKSFVELHQGKMWLESAPGVGTTFYFTLPVDPPAVGEGGALRWLNPDWPLLQRTRPSLAPKPSVKLRLVVLEAGDALQHFLRRYLDQAEITPVRNLEDALKELSTWPAQALLINEIALQASPSRLDLSSKLPYGTPAIICSVPGMLDAASALGVSAYLLKPVSQEALLSALARLQLGAKRKDGARTPNQTSGGRKRGSPSKAGGPSATILVVDDEPDAMRLFWRILASADRGYRILTALDGEQALQMLRQECCDVLLLDLAMPRMDGFQLLAAKNEDPALRNIPVVVLSASDPSGDPVMSDALAVTRGGGLTLQQLLSCIGAISSILSPGLPRVDPELQGNPPG